MRALSDHVRPIGAGHRCGLLLGARRGTANRCWKRHSRHQGPVCRRWRGLKECVRCSFAFGKEGTSLRSTEISFIDRERQLPSRGRRPPQSRCAVIGQHSRHRCRLRKCSKATEAEYLAAGTVRTRQVGTFCTGYWAIALRERCAALPPAALLRRLVFRAWSGKSPKLGWSSGQYIPMNLVTKFSGLLTSRQR